MQDTPTLNARALQVMFEYIDEQLRRRDESRPSLMRRLRTGLGRRLIATGSSLAAPSVDSLRPKSA